MSSAASATAITEYCQLKSTINEFNHRLKNSVDPLTEKKQRLQAGLLEWMRANGFTVLELPPSQNVPQNSSSSKPVVVYRCLRIKNYRSRSDITPARVQTACSKFISSSSLPQQQQQHIPMSDSRKIRELKEKTLKDLYESVRSVCCTTHEGVAYCATIRRPKNIPQEQAQRQKEHISPDDLARLASIADELGKSCDTIKERRQHYTSAKRIVQQKIEECTPRVCEYLQQQQQTSTTAAAASARHQQVSLTLGYTEPATTLRYSLSLKEKAAAAPPTAAAGASAAASRRITYKVLSDIISHVISRRLSKMQDQGTAVIKPSDWYRHICSDLVREIEHRAEISRSSSSRSKKKHSAAAAAAVSSGSSSSSGGSGEYTLVMRKLPDKHRQQQHQQRPRKQRSPQ